MILSMQNKITILRNVTGMSHASSVVLLYYFRVSFSNYAFRKISSYSLNRSIINEQYENYKCWFIFDISYSKILDLKSVYVMFHLLC